MTVLLCYLYLNRICKSESIENKLHSRTAAKCIGKSGKVYFIEPYLTVYYKYTLQPIENKLHNRTTAKGMDQACL